jgi:predicted protein tyrosine phosphatase
MMKNILFVCSQNKLRSPTAEKVFSDNPNLKVASAGLDNDAVITLTPELIEWADLIFVMEKNHQNRLQKKFKKYLTKQRIISLNIPDEYDYMDPALIEILKSTVPKYLRG